MSLWTVYCLWNWRADHISFDSNSNEYLAFQDRDSSHPSEDGASGDVDRELPSTASDAVASTDGAVETSAEPPKEEQQAPQSEQSEEESSKDKYRKKRQ